MLQGRGYEQGVLTRLLDAVRQGRSGALVLTGEAGAGKTALLDDAVATAGDLAVVRIGGVEAERELPFAALHQLCAPLLDRLDRLPAPQCEALQVTFGMRAGFAPAPFFVGLAVLSLLAEAAADKPLVCVVDDAQWLDHASAQTLAFAARRLHAESVAVIFAARDTSGETAARDTSGETAAGAPAAGAIAGGEASRNLRDLPELRVAGLRDADARKLLATVVRWPLDADVREAILAEARGNPLALLELPLGRSPLQLAGGFQLPGTAPLTGRIEQSFLRRVDELPEPARLLLLLAAADPVGDAALLWRAAGRLGLGQDAGDPLHEAGLLQIGVRVLFRHPLVRSVTYGSAPEADRRRVHRALAEATSRAADPDRRAWHRAHATAGSDEAVAGELEASAGRAQSRGGLAAAAAFLQRAAEQTADPVTRADRDLAAARATYRAGSPGTAAALLARAQAGPPDAVREARIGLLRGQMAFASPAHSTKAPGLLLAAARGFEATEPALARRTYLEAFAGAVFVGRFAGDAGLAEVAAAARTAPPAPVPTPADALLDGLALLYTDGYHAAAALIRRAVAGLLRQPAEEETIHSAYVVAHAAQAVWDDHAWQELTARQLRTARATGALAGLTFSLYQRLAVHLHQGEIAEAAALVDEIEAVGVATGDRQPPMAALAVAAWRGREAAVARLMPGVTAVLTERNQGAVLSTMYMFEAVLQNGLGRFDRARAAAEAATAFPLETSFANWALAELVEAAARCGDRRAAAVALDRLTARTAPSATDWALGVEARCRALLDGGAGAEGCHREAITRLTGSRGTFTLARAHLSYGEWLRQQGRTEEAKADLRTAHDLFLTFGAEAFAARAGAELAAAGEPIRTRAAATPAALTEQELRIAQRARDGQSNAEIGAELFLSGRTVEWHLRKVFTKLAITGRRDLRTALPERPARVG